MPFSFPQRVSLLLLAHNQESTVRLAAESCLSQRCEPLEIVLSDDASSDDTYGILRQLAFDYRGPHRVIARRNEKNLGIGEHYNRLVSCSTGQLLVTAAGDDWSVPHRVERLVRAWDDTGGRADLVSSHVVDLDHDGALHGVLRVDDLSDYAGVDEWAKRRPYVIGAGHAFTRRMMERFGPLGRDVFYEDEIMAFRAIAGGGGVTVDEALVHYRRGGTSRRPDAFDSLEQRERWASRQRDREIAVMEQMIADAFRVGCDGLMRDIFGLELRKDGYLRQARRAQGNAELWRLFLGSRRLPVWWRLRKILHVAYPHRAAAIRSALCRMHGGRRTLVSKLSLGQTD